MHFATFQYIVIIICGICNGLTAAYVLCDNPRRVINRSFAVFTGGITLWNLGMPLLFFFRDSAYISVILEGGVLLATGLFFFGKAFPEGKMKKGSFWLLVPMAVIAVLVPFKLFISSATITSSGYIVPHNEPLFFVYALALVFYMLGGVYFLMTKYVGSSEIIRSKLRYFFFGITLFAVISLVCDVILPNFSVYEFNLVGPLISLFFVGTTAYGIVRYNLMDIRLVIQRSLIYVLLVGITIGLYIVGLQFLGYLLHKATDITSIISAGTITVLGIFFMQPVRTYLEKITDPIFFKEKYVYSDALEQLSRMLNTSMGQGDIIATSKVALREIFKTAYVEFSIGTQQDTPSEESVLILPIVFETHTIGTIELGKKRSGDAYTYQDMQLLETFLHHAAVALEKGRLYEQVQEYNTRLEQIVEERTKEIKKIQEEQKQTMIDISHNLQTPLAVIRSELELMTEYSNDSGKMVAAKRSLMRISEFIRQLLHLARLDGSVYDITFSPVDLSALVREQTEYFEIMGVEQRLLVTADIQEGIVMPGNKRLLGEALTNIAQNAVKYRRENVASTLHITLQKQGTDIELTIEDNGMGIAKKDQADIFTRFHRTSRTSENVQGVGLGLAIVNKIVEMHKGKISVASALGKGTCFTILFTP
jgi:signal transduction histidine kinase